MNFDNQKCKGFYNNPNKNLIYDVNGELPNYVEKIKKIKN